MPVKYDFCRNSENYRVWRNTFVNYASHSDNGSIPDGATIENDRSRADENIVPDDNPSVCVPLIDDKGILFLVFPVDANYDNVRTKSDVVTNFYIGLIG